MTFSKRHLVNVNFFKSESHFEANKNSEVSVCAQRRIISCGFSAPHEQRRTAASLLMRCPVSEHVHVHVHVRAASKCTCPAELEGA